MKLLSAAALAATAFFAVAPAAQADVRVKVGVLSCEVVGGVGFIIGSTRDIACTFRPASGKKAEYYAGQISRFGIDIGAVKYTGIAWAVLAPTGYVKRGALEGGYVGASAEATVGVGVGANALIGGFGRSIVLNPISLQAQTGANLAVGIAGLSLTAR